MAFKSKTPLDAFDKNNTSVKDTEYNSLKTLTKNGVKKLATANGATTPFHLILDYFKDDKEKPLAHFLDLGINVKLGKHFGQVEMKPGKLDKSMSNSPKEAASGVAFIKAVDGVNTLHFQPAEQCKIPGGKWTKIIKALKPYLAGYPAVVVLGEQEQEEITGENTPESSSSPVASRAAKMTKLENNLAAIEKALGIDLEEDVV